MTTALETISRTHAVVWVNRQKMH